MLAEIRRATAFTIAQPYIRRELPGWGRVFDLLVGGYQHDALWRDLAPRWIQGKLHGYEMRLDLGGWSNRKTYFLGRFYDLATQLTLKVILRPGNTFIDIGANEGMMSLLAAHLVGSSGKVIAFEPNPRPREIFEAAIGRNDIKQIDLRPIGVGDADATLTLHVPRINSGEGSFGQPAYLAKDIIEIVCAVRRGDAELEASQPDLIKIDVEGFEEHVLRGLDETITRARCPVVTEIVGAHLRRAESSVAALEAIFSAWGYRPFAMCLARAGLKRRLLLRPAELSPSYAGDILWVHQDDARMAELARRYGL